MPTLGNIVTAMVTPFDADLQVDYDRAVELAKRLADAGSDLLVSGTTGESPTTSADEKLKLFEVVRAGVDDSVTVLAGTGNNNTAASIELTQKAGETGVDAVMLVGPYYNKPSQEGFYQHFCAVATSTDLPVVLYNVPGRTGKSIDAATTLRVGRDMPNVIGVKEASGDLELIGEIIAGAPEGFRVWSGDDGMTLPILALGGVGVISVASHVAGVQIKEMVDAFHAGETERAWTLHHQLMRLVNACFLASGNPACVKRALELCGFPVGGTRLPVVPASEADTMCIQAACEGLGLV